MITLRESVILILVVAGVFGLSLAASFHLDDYSLLSDPVVTAPSGWIEAWAPAQTRPLTYFTFWLNYRLGRRNPLGYHAVNLLLHLACVLLLWDVLRGLIAARAAFFAAILFAVHPIQAEAVSYVFDRGTLLAALFCLLSWRSWVKDHRWRAAGWFALALLSKEECAAFPLFLLLLHFSASRAAKGFRPAVAMIALSLAAGLRVVYATAVLPGAGAGFQAGLSPLEYFASQGPVILRYFRLLVLPWGFTIDPDIHVPGALAAIAAWLAILAVAFFAARRFSGLRAGFWWLGGMLLLLPSSSIFPAADLAADRRMYLPMCAFAAAAALPLRNARNRVLVPAAVVLALLGVARTQVWLTEKSLWQEAVDRSPQKVRPKIQLARALPPADALPLLREAQALAPGDPRVASELGKTYMLLGQPPQALAEFGRALALAPRDAQALNNRGVALLALGQYDAARQDFQRALGIRPCLFDARFNLKRLGEPADSDDNCHFSEEQWRLLGVPEK